jgi:hypothetical protein
MKRPAAGNIDGRAVKTAAPATAGTTVLFSPTTGFVSFLIDAFHLSSAP